MLAVLFHNYKEHFRNLYSCMIPAFCFTWHPICVAILSSAEYEFDFLKFYLVLMFSMGLKAEVCDGEPYRHRLQQQFNPYFNDGT